MKIDTASCLLRYPWRTLDALGVVYDVPAHHHRPKEDVVQELAAMIHARLPQTLDGLAPEPRAALRALAEADGGLLPRAEFVACFGSLHPYRPWRAAAPPAPWPDPPSPAAVLVHYGLAYPIDVGAEQHPLPVVLLPSDLHDAVLARLDRPASPAAPDAPAEPAPAAAPDLTTDLFAFLSLLNRDDYPVRHERWLPPRALKVLNPHLSRPDDLGPGRSELQAERTPFLHYLAERAGLVALAGGHLKPTAAAADWLAQPPPDRFQSLWAAWCATGPDNATLWQRYRLPLAAEDDPPARFEQLRTLLAIWPPGPPTTRDSLLQTLYERDPTLFRPPIPYREWQDLPAVMQAEYRQQMEEGIADLLTGPLAWFGAVQTDGTHLALTPLGAALLGREDGRWPVDPPPPSLKVAPKPVDHGREEAFRFEVAEPGGSSAAGLTWPLRFRLEAVVPPDPEAPGRYWLSRRIFQQALQRGHSAAGILDLLEEIAGPLPPLLVGALHRWEAEFGRVALRQVILLETRDPELLQELTSRRRIRETLMETLSPRAVRVDASRLEALVRRLTWRGFIPQLDLAEGGPPSSDELSAEDRAIIAAALRLYAHLAEELGVPSRPPHTLVRRWEEGLDVAGRDAAERRVDQVLERLRQVAEPEDAYNLPVPTGPLLDELEEAIAAGATVEIDYYTAGRDHRSVRRVDPLRLEWRGDVAYLIAHCHRRSDQRVFRVDRIQALQRARAGKSNLPQVGSQD